MGGGGGGEDDDDKSPVGVPYKEGTNHFFDFKTLLHFYDF
jgi:hypothetical protein